MNFADLCLAYKMRGQSAQGEMEEVAAELREDDEELRVRFRKNSKSLTSIKF